MISIRLHLRPCVAVLFAAVLAAAIDRDKAVQEYELKAAVVFNLAKFVEWPPDTLKGPADPIAICVIGESPIAGRFAAVCRGEYSISTNSRSGA